MTESEKVPGSFKRGNETQLTYDLKMAAWEWLYREAGCRVIGLEVRLEGPFGRIVDIAAVGPSNVFYIVEVKSTRSDFSKDNHTPGDLSELRRQEIAFVGRTSMAKETLRQAIHYAKQTRPDSWREVPAVKQAMIDYTRSTEKEQAFQKKMATYSTKFHDPSFMGIADFHYLIAPKWAVNRRILPPQWGLLDETCTVCVPAKLKRVRKEPGIVSNFLRAIARSNTTSMMRSHGVADTNQQSGVLQE